MDEKRRAPRFEVDWPLRAHLATGQRTRGRTINISTSGVQFRAQQHYNIGDTVLLEIAVQRLVFIQCVVSIQREIEPTAGSYSYGAEFKEMSAEDCHALAQALLIAQQAAFQAHFGRPQIDYSAM